MVHDVDFRKAFVKADEFLIHAGVTSFPFDMRAFVRQEPGCVCRTFAKARSYGIDIEDFGSESAVLIQKQGRSIIFIDERKPDCHTNFSIAHEFGHLSCGHDLYDKRMSIEKYNRCEIEANFFAAQVLMPEQIIRELQRRGMRITAPVLQLHFGVSSQAATKRLETLNRMSAFHRSRSEQEFDDILLGQCQTFLETIRPTVSLFDFDREYEQQRLRESWL